MIKALVKKSLQQYDVTVIERPEPPLLPGTVRVRTEACGICGSDVHAWRQDQGYEWVRPPVTLGHEAVGYIDSVGDDSDTQWLGKRVVPISLDGCGDCVICQSGRPQFCPDRSVLGITFDGAAAESFAIPTSRLVVVPERVDAVALALIEPLSVVCHALALLELPDDFDGQVVVSGPGPIGLVTALLLKQRGVAVVLTGAERDMAYRLPCAAALGVETRVAGRDALPLYPAAWVEASGAGSALNAACEKVMPDGSVVVVGLFGAPAGLDMNTVVRRQIRVQGSYSSVRSDYEAALAVLLQDPALWSSLVTKFPFEDGIAALEKTASAQVIKAVLVPQQRER